MNLNQLTQGEPWMTPDEEDRNRDLIRAIGDYLAAAGVSETPFVVLRVNDVAATWLLACRLETALAPTESDPAPCPTPAQANAIGRCRDRIRKTLKELEACCAETGNPAPHSLLEHLHQLAEDRPEADPRDREATPTEPQTTEIKEIECEESKNHTPATPHNPGPAEKAHTPPKNTAQPETQFTIPTPSQPESPATPAPPPAKPSRKRKAAKGPRKKRGCPRRSRAS